MKARLVVPCYNEAERLDAEGFLGLAARDPALGLLFVDDGSRDDTAARLRTLAGRLPDRLAVLSLPRNQGKAEAVRQGLLEALASDAEIVGYVDADLATPVPEIERLLAKLRGSGAQILLASRVALLGREIHRSPGRHYLGRLFATAASSILGLRVYDTQCGAKLFRRSDALTSALAEPFLSRWCFDVELLGRLIEGSRRGGGHAPSILEEPLLHWKDVPGSKLRGRHMVGAAGDLALIWRDLRRRRERLRAR
jgi:dolichyl-phosphate beta-glucosyltransferase